MKLALEHLYALGHRRIAYLTTLSGTETSDMARGSLPAVPAGQTAGLWRRFDFPRGFRLQHRHRGRLPFRQKDARIRQNLYSSNLRQRPNGYRSHHRYT